MRKSLILTPQQVFETLVSRSAKTQEEILKLSCKQYLISRVLKNLEERNLSEFLSIVENEKLDFSNISKMLSLSDTPDLSTIDDNLLDLWLYSQSENMRLFKDVPILQSHIQRSHIVRWFFGSFISDEVINPTELVPQIANRVSSVMDRILNIDAEDEKEVLGELMEIWEYAVKQTIFQLSNQPPMIAKKIRETLAPFYFRPIIERFEKEWVEVQREEQEFLSSSVKNSDNSPTEEFSLPDDFFAKENNCAQSFHMNIRPEVIHEGAHKFEKFLMWGTKRSVTLSVAW
jgi:hypothetical protein